MAVKVSKKTVVAIIEIHGQIQYVESNIISAQFLMNLKNIYHILHFKIHQHFHDKTVYLSPALFCIY